MVDVTGSKTMVLVLAIVLIGAVLCMARMSRRDAAGAEGLLVDATTHADQIAEAAGRIRLHPAAKPVPKTTPPAAAPTWGRRSMGKVNTALREIESLEKADQAAGQDWRSRRGQAGRLDDWRH